MSWQTQLETARPWRKFFDEGYGNDVQSRRARPRSRISPASGPVWRGMSDKMSGRVEEEVEHEKVTNLEGELHLAGN